MDSVKVLLWLGVLSGIVAGYTIPTTHRLHEKREYPHSRWTRRDRIALDVTLPVRIGLRQNQEALDRGPSWLIGVSDPTSSKYGQHWSQDQVIEAFKPSNETVEAVTTWLHNQGIAASRITHSDNKAWLAFDASTAEAENLFNTEFYEHDDRLHKGRVVAACKEYSIPVHLQQHIDFVTPGIKGVDLTSTLRKRDAFRRKLSARAHSRQGVEQRPPRVRPPPDLPPSWNPSSLSTCDSLVTPSCLQALYHYWPLPPKAKVSPDNSMGIFEEGDYYSQEDLDLFYTNFTRYIPNGTHPILDSIDGGQAPVPVGQAGVESNLDFTLAIPIVYPQTTTLYQTDDRNYALGIGPVAENTTGIFNTFLDAIDGSYCTYSAFGETGNDPVLDPTYPDPEPGGYKGPLQCGVYKPTNTLSISYGEQEQDLPAYYQQRQCNEFLKLGLQGVSVFVASGDTGVGGLPGDGADNGCLRNGTVFSPTQPNSCPWLTNVGATEIYPNRTVFEPESAVWDWNTSEPMYDGFWSGGGFSNIFPAPDYQRIAIDKYFDTSNPPYPYYFDGDYENSTGVYNRNGRGIPDVSAIGLNVAVYVRGKLRRIGGTSASSPLFAALVTRINEERIALGKSTVGFINPVLYKHPEVLMDIVNGTNPGCGTQGFSCAPGWDPVTGLGTPNFPAMLGLFLSLP